MAFIPQFPAISGSDELTSPQHAEFDSLLRKASLSRSSILNAMVFCLDNAVSATRVSQILVNWSRGNPDDSVSLETWLSRLYVLSDVLSNAGSGFQSRAWVYRTEVEPELPEIFYSFGLRLRKPQTPEEDGKKFRHQVELVLKAWEETSLFAEDFLRGLRSTFLYGSVGSGGGEEEVVKRFDEFKQTPRMIRKVRHITRHRPC